MNQPVTIAVLEGTTRPARKSPLAARYVLGQLEVLPDVQTIYIDPAEFHFPGDGNDPDGIDPRYSELSARADGFVIVAPEYNHSFSGSLKRMLDTEYGNYHHKPVLLAGVSNGAWGGTRVVEALLPVMRSLGLLPCQSTLYFPRVQDIFDGEGAMKHEFIDQYQKSTAAGLNELLELTRALKQGRAISS